MRLRRGSHRAAETSGTSKGDPMPKSARLIALAAAAALVTSVPSVAAPTASDRKFMTDAAADGMAEVALGKLAAEKGSTQAVKEFGKMMVDDHTKANAELKSLAEKKDVTLPAGPRPPHKAL